MKPNELAYLNSWAQELKARSSRVRFLIGDAHWLSDGKHKEAIVREFVQRYLSPDICVGTGFVASPHKEVSPEVDVLVSDFSLSPALFNEQGLQIVSPSSVLAHIEVKTELKKDTLRGALSAVSKTQQTIASYSNPNNVWRGICFFVEAAQTPERVLGTIRDVLDEHVQKVKLELGANLNDVTVMSLLPLCVTTLDRTVTFISDDLRLGKVKLKHFDLGELSLATALVDMYAALRRRRQGAVAGELEEIIRNVATSEPLTETVNI